MYNPNPNMWPTVGQTFGYNNSNQMAVNTRVLLQNQQNLNHLMPYYNQNQGFGQHLQQINNNYNYFRPTLPVPSYEAMGSSYLSQPNQTFSANPLTQTYPMSVQKPIPSLVTNNIQTINTNQTTVNENQNSNQTNDYLLNDNKWLDLLNATQKQVLDQLNKEQEEFELVFKNWEKDFENWKQVNRLHPDITAYQTYVNQWQEWRQRLVDRQQQMKALRNRTLEQLHSQVSQQLTKTQRIDSSNPPPLPPEPNRPPDVPPPPSTEGSIPPPPPSTERSIPPPPPQNSIPTSEKPNTCSFLSPNKILEIHKNINSNENKLNVNLEEFINKTNEGKIVNNEDNVSNDSIEILKPNPNADNKSDKNIEIIEIDCEINKNDGNKSESKIDSNNAISKATEAILFIQKQQELLKSLENFKHSKNNDLQVIDGPKGFDVKDIVTKMKAIRPPENPIEANKLLSQLPSLQGIVFENKSDLQNNEQKTYFNNQSFQDSPHEPYQTFPKNNTNPLYANNYRMQSIRNRLPFDSMQTRPQRPQFPIDRRPSYLANPNTNRNFPQFNSPNQWTNTNPNIPREKDYFYRINDNSTPQQTDIPVVRKYSAQTIDYNHRHENRSADKREDPMLPSVESQSHYSHKPMESFTNYKFNEEFVENSIIKSDNNYNSMNSLKTPEKVIETIEETISYTDLRYFTQPKSRIIQIDDLLRPPTREFRPQNIVIILRGLPGSGKSYIAKLIKEKEIEFGGSAPRILSIDDYFMSEVERQIKDTESGKTIKTKEYVYEYEYDMESCYRASLLKTYKKTIDDRLFPFIIVDAVNELIGDIEDFYSYAIKNAFVIYVLEMSLNEPSICHKNNSHNRKLEDIRLIHKKWQLLPDFMLRLDIRSFLQNDSIKNVEMETNSTKTDETLKRKSESDSDISKKQMKSFEFEDDINTHSSLSRWERMEASETKLDKLDSFKMKTKPTIDEYLQVTDDYEQREQTKDGHKRVRWADIEESKKQQQMRRIGFVVGLDWHQYMDPQHCEQALTKTKYF